MSNSEAPLILSIETATRAGSIAVSRGQRIMASRAGDPAVSHSSDLLRDIQISLEEAAVTLRDVDVFAAATGPGSFTGLRIGLATVKSFAATLKRPCTGVPTLEAVAYDAGPSLCTLALLPAGRGEVFAQLFSVNEEGLVKALDKPEHLAPHLLIERISERRTLVLAGEGAHLYDKIFRERAQAEEIEYTEKQSDLDHPATEHTGLWRLAPLAKVLAESVAAQAFMRYRSGELDGADQLRAVYVRLSDAELKERC